ncbi:MAG TPA: tyrosine-type recombinase/integrase [Steroidobacteraceae bacterium]|nr:tyrosine-type recombinase/integrase [Steroidobacteraceae bacterium]
MNRPRKHDKHLPASVYLRHGAYYHVRAGRWTRLGKTLREALETYAAIQEAPKSGMAELIDQAMAHIRPKVAKNTAKQYDLAAKHLKEWLQEFAPGEVKPRDVAAMKLKLASKPNWANRCLSLLRQIFDYALEQQIVESNPAVGIKRHAEKKRTRLVSMGEYHAIYAAAGPRLQVIMDLCIRTGQRISDVLKIRRADLTDDGIRFEQQKTGHKGVVAWTPELRAVVERAKTLHGNIRALTLLHNRRGKAPDYSTVKIQWDKARRAAGVDDVRLHDLRALAATWAKKQGKNPTSLLMHSTPSQTVRYLRDKEEPLSEGPSFGQSKDSAEK